MPPNTAIGFSVSEFQASLKSLTGIGISKPEAVLAIKIAISKITGQPLNIAFSSDEIPKQSHAQ